MNPKRQLAVVLVDVALALGIGLVLWLARRFKPRLIETGPTR